MKYTVRVYEDNGGLLFTYKTDDYLKAVQLVEALKSLFNDIDMVEH